CKAGGIPKEEIGVKDEEKIIPGTYESMCNPISQAEILNEEGCDFNIAMGLCVGHDSLFLKHANAPTTVFAVKDRLLGHNPLAALYQSRQYYRRLRTAGGIPGKAEQ
ncbi:MAG: metal-binding protein, partial [Dehalococcoidia bacterium SM23_28_1]